MIFRAFIVKKCPLSLSCSIFVDMSSNIKDQLDFMNTFWSYSYKLLLKSHYNQKYKWGNRI